MAGFGSCGQQMEKSKLLTEEKSSMQKSRKTSTINNHSPVEVGDLVRCILRGAPEYESLGIVLERLYYFDHDNGAPANHPDEYSCRVLFDEGEKMFRGRWLIPVSKKNL